MDIYLELGAWFSCLVNKDADSGFGLAECIEKRRGGIASGIDQPGLRKGRERDNNRRRNVP